MSSYGTLSGRYGDVSQRPVNLDGSGVGDYVFIDRITRWRFRPSLIEFVAWADSDTSGYVARAAGAKDATFSTEGVYQFLHPDNTEPVYDMFQPGDKRAVRLWENRNVANLFWYFPSALCIDFEFVVDVDTERVIGWSAEWGADGAFYRPGQSP